jgi:hypothetical protein
MFPRFSESSLLASASASSSGMWDRVLEPSQAKPSQQIRKSTNQQINKLKPSQAKPRQTKPTNQRTNKSTNQQSQSTNQQINKLKPSQAMPSQAKWDRFEATDKAGEAKWDRFEATDKAGEAGGDLRGWRAGGDAMVALKSISDSTLQGFGKGGWLGRVG